MTKSLLTISALVLALAAPSVQAQQTAETTEGAEAPAETAEPVQRQVRPTNETAEIGQVYETINGDWIVACEKTLAGDDPCRMGQLLTDADNNAVMETELTRLQGDNLPDAVMVIKTPLLTLLPEGVTLSIDGSNPAKIPFLFCDNSTCVARVNLRDQDVAAFKRGALANVRIVPLAAPDQSVTVEMSLSGFTASYDSLPPVSQP